MYLLIKLNCCQIFEEQSIIFPVNHEIPDKFTFTFKNFFLLIYENLKCFSKNIEKKEKKS